MIPESPPFGLVELMPYTSVLTLDNNVIAR
jgi:hypothetical protein